MRTGWRLALDAVLGGWSSKEWSVLLCPCSKSRPWARTRAC